MKWTWTAVILVLLGGAIWGALFLWKNFKGALPLLRKPKEGIVELIEKQSKVPRPQNLTGMPLKLPDGFSIEIFAKNLPGARVMKFDGLGNMWVSQTSEGKISRLEIKDGKVTNTREVFGNLRKPHGLAFDPDDLELLYFAEEDRIARVNIHSGGDPQKVAALPFGDGHFTRTLGFGPESRLYVSIGSSCNVCNESDHRRAKIFSLRKDGTDFKEFARGLRNAVFFTWSPFDYKMWVTEMGRDWLGDDAPPDEINIVQEGKNYGWPVCYGKNIHDTDFDPVPDLLDRYGASKNTACSKVEPSYIDIPAHSAPLGLAFIPQDVWPEEYAGDLLVAYHGSWNRSEPTGYKIIRIKLDDKGNYLGIEDFITGWYNEKNEVLGRPVDILIGPGGVIYVSDDKAGVIYKVTYNNE